jgi:hypothetical protein
MSKPEILRKLKLRFATKTVRDVRFRVGDPGEQPLGALLRL